MFTDNIYYMRYTLKLFQKLILQQFSKYNGGLCRLMFPFDFKRFPSAVIEKAWKRTYTLNKEGKAAELAWGFNFPI